jgi:polysaccharide export outer membrane protein
MFRLARSLLSCLFCCLTIAPPMLAQKADYVIGPQDVLTITLYDQMDLSGKYVVDSEGMFTFPLVGRVKAGGLTLQGLEGALRTRLKDGYFKDPQLSVIVEQYRSQRVFVMGEVRTPGPYPLTGDMTVMEAMALAGSVTQGASSEAVIVRLPSGNTADGPAQPDQAEAEVLRVDLAQLEAGALSQNIRLQDGDTIFVKRAEGEVFYVAGQVRSPGSFQTRRGLTVLQALSLAGGLTERGSDARVRTIRFVNGKKVEVRVKLDDLVQPGDTIVVPERFF